MVTMSVLKIGDKVVVARAGQHVPDAGEVLGVTQYVVGEGRYVNVKFADGRTEVIHESFVRLT